GIEQSPMLVEIGDLQARAQNHLARRRRDFIQDELQQRALAATVRADDADAVAAQNVRREIADDHAIAVAEADMPQIDDELAGNRAGVDAEARFPLGVEPSPAFVPQGLELPHAPFVARAARLDTLAYPRFLFRQLFVE